MDGDPVEGRRVQVGSALAAATRIPQKGKLKLSIDIDIDDLEDPKGLGQDVRDVGHWGNGNVEFVLSSAEDLEYAMSLIVQAYEAESADGDS